MRTVEVPHRVIVKNNNIATRTVQPKFSDLHNTLLRAGNNILGESTQHLLYLCNTCICVCVRWKVTDSAKSTQVL